MIPLFSFATFLCGSGVADGGVYCLPDNFVSGAISHVAVQLDVQRKSATHTQIIPPSGSQSDQYPPSLGLSPARHYMAEIFVARRGVNTNLRAGEIWRVSPDTLEAAAGTICRGLYSFVGNNYLDCVIK